MTRVTPITDLITLLDGYNESHISASSSLKSSIWNINKARQTQRRNIMTFGKPYSALDIREELRAQTVLECSTVERGCEPELKEEVQEDLDAKVPQLRVGDKFSLHFHGIPVEGQDKRSNDKFDGIRQRNTLTSVEIEENIATLSLNDLNAEEEKLRNTDPLELLTGGLVPKDLKSAQKNARESLRSYIAAANKAAEILKITSLLAEREGGKTS